MKYLLPLFFYLYRRIKTARNNLRIDRVCEDGANSILVATKQMHLVFCAHIPHLNTIQHTRIENIMILIK